MAEQCVVLAGGGAPLAQNSLTTIWGDRVHGLWAWGLSHVWPTRHSFCHQVTLFDAISAPDTARKTRAVLQQIVHMLQSTSSSHEFCPENSLVGHANQTLGCRFCSIGCFVSWSERMRFGLCPITTDSFGRYLNHDSSACGHSLLEQECWSHGRSKA